MHPILANLGPIPIHTYGFLIAIGFIVAVQVIQWHAKKSGLDAEKIQDLVFGCLAIGFLGARIVFIMTRFSYFMENPIDMFKVWEGGLVFYGGPLAATPFAIWFIRKHRFPLWRTLDSLAAGLVVAHAFGRMGCLAAGCCYGKPTDVPWAIKLNSELVDPALRGIPLHPTQIYESLALFILFFGLLIAFKRRRFEGQVALIYFMAYPIIRSVIEIYRGDTIRGFFIEGILSTSQAISALIFIAAAVFAFRRIQQVNAAPVAKGAR
jgi:phosphatidylglycerol:prolipoprotein diacylglycerol transferase